MGRKNIKWRRGAHELLAANFDGDYRDIFYRLAEIHGGEMRKGWYKRARRKFVKKRVYDWRFGNGWYSYSDKLRYRRDGIRTYQYNENAWEQRIRKLLDAGFVKGFWLARYMAKKKKLGDFYWHKILDE